MSTTVTATRATPGSGVDSRHPLYTEFLEDWEQMRDTHRGERIVKQRGLRYLKPTAGMVADGMANAEAPGFKAYDAYRSRAVFPDIIKDAVEAMMGVMHHKPATIELPAALEPMRENATLRKESLEMLLRRINEEQLITGRLGLLLDLPERLRVDPTITPYVAFYVAEKVINWDEGRRDGIVVDNVNLVILDESEYERKPDFVWEFEQKFRVLTLGDPNDVMTGDRTDDDSVENEPEGEGEYLAGVFRDVGRQFSIEEMEAPILRGQTLDEIPFVFVNASDVVPEPDQPPLLGLSNLSLTIYRGEADYRQSLFQQGQDTFVTIGATENDEVRVGGDAKYVGVDSSGLSEQREAIQNDKAQASQRGGQLLDSVSRERESGDALTIRVAARTATLNQIALAGAFGLERILKIAAKWIGADPEEVVVKPNLDFVDETLGSKELVEWQTAKNLGAPISSQTIHRNMQDKGITELDFEKELEAIEEEEPLGGSTNPNGPEPDPEPEPEPEPEPDDE